MMERNILYKLSYIFYPQEIKIIPHCFHPTKILAILENGEIFEKL